MTPEAKIGVGVAMAIIGLYFVICAIIALTLKVTYPPYSWLVSKSSMMWKGAVHYFYIICGLAIIAVGIVLAIGLI